MEGLVLAGAHIRLEPLSRDHIKGLVAAVSVDPSLYDLTPVPRSEFEAARYVDTALEWQEAGNAVPFAIVSVAGGVVIGSTRFWNLERWVWPEHHPQHGRGAFDVCEIGHTWLAGSAIRSAVNTETKLLMLTHAFETWKVLRVCFHTDARNQRSRRAIERIGGKFEGILRAQRMAADLTVRDSARFSIMTEEWPPVKQQLRSFLDQARTN